VAQDSARCTLGRSVCGGAIEGKRLELVKWLHEDQQCEWSEIAGSMAARSANLSMLKYIHSKSDGGAPSRYSSVEARGHFSLSAVVSNSPRILSWCRKKRLLVDNWWRNGEPTLYYQSILADCTRVQSWLFRHGYRLLDTDSGYAAMMQRHSSDVCTAEESTASDSTASSEAYSSSNSTCDSGDDNDSENDSASST
jgi:hypothetical protein